MKDGRYVLALGLLSALFFGFTSHVVAKIFGRDLGADTAFTASAVLGGLFFGVMLAVLRDRGRIS